MIDFEVKKKFFFEKNLENSIIIQIIERIKSILLIELGHTCD